MKKARVELAHECGAVVRAVPGADGKFEDEVRCGGCGETHALHTDKITEHGGLLGCVACGHPELYRQKVFPALLGIAIVVVAAWISEPPYYLALWGAVVLDTVLFLFMPEACVCYVCNAFHRNFHGEPRHPKFDREIEERLKFGEKAVMGKPMRPGGTAGAPEPEH